MRQSHRRGLIALTAVAGLLLAGCGDSEQAAQEDPTAGETGTEEGAEDPTGAAAPDDPNQDVEDGVYRGNGVLLPVPDGFTLNQQAFAQGIVAAVSEGGTQQMTAQAVDAAQLEGSGQELDLQTLVDGVRQQIDQEPEVDEEVELANAQAAHRLTYLEMPAQQEGAPPSSATILIAESGDGIVGEFAFSAAAEDYDQETAELLLAEAGFDPESEPPEVPQQQAPAPQQGQTGEPQGTEPEGSDG